MPDFTRPGKNKDYWICKGKCQDFDRTKELRLYRWGGYSKTTDGQDPTGDRVRLCCRCGTSGRTSRLKCNRTYKAYIFRDQDRHRCDVRRQTFLICYEPRHMGVGTTPQTPG